MSNVKKNVICCYETKDRALCMVNTCELLIDEITLYYGSHGIKTVDITCERAMKQVVESFNIKCHILRVTG